MSWCCYLLQCADDTLYCGITNDLDKRLAAHNAGEGAKYTRGRTPVKLLYREPCAGKSAALKREMQIKKMSRGEKLNLCKSARQHATTTSTADWEGYIDPILADV